MMLSIQTNGGALSAEQQKLMQAFGDATAEFHNTEILSLVQSLEVSDACAADVSYLRTRSRHTPELEQRLIASHKAGRTVMICDWPDHEDGNYDPLTGNPL